MTAADDIHKYFFIVFSEKIRLDISCKSSAKQRVHIKKASESFAGQRIHLKNQALFSWKGKSKKLRCRLLQFLFGTLRVNNRACLAL